jgi:CIC family chloride channel protein
MPAAELTTALNAFTPDTPLVKAIKADRTPILFPDLALDTALPHFPRWPLLPIQNRASRGTLEGIVTLEDILSRYRGR